MDEADRDPKEIYHINGRYYSLLIRNINESAGNRLMMIEDRTDKTLADRRLRQESKMVAVGQLSAGLAHEIRNPMGLIRSYSYILEDYATDEISSHALNVIDESMNRINRLIENLLNFSKPGREAFVMVDIGMLFNNIESLERKKMEKAEIDFRMICPARTEFYTDEEALKVILINLIDNGFEALIRGDASLAHNKMLFCSAKKVKKGLEICIEDNGPGMTEEQQEQVFNPFYTTKDNGTGLGLYLVNAELEKLGGNIRMVSRKGEGTVFTVFLPEAGGN